ncbi:MAG: hypothetical protein E7623_04585 [Ruminococcaceae bacterium]|nr:hypothetical protein [Oscillospiraceae bacterium]
MNDKRNFLNKIRETADSGEATLRSIRLKVKSKDIKKYLPLALKLLKGTAVLLISALFCSTNMAFSSLPIGFALLGALDTYAFFAYMGAVISSIFAKGLALQLFIVYSAEICLRLLLCKLLSDGERKIKLFSEPLKLKLANSAIMSALFSLYKLFTGGLLYYDLMSTVFSVLLSPILCFLLYGIFSSEEKIRLLHKEAGLYSLCFLMIYAFRSYTLFGFSLSVCTSFLLTLIISKNGGALRGALAGTVCGAALGTGKILSFAAAGLSSGLLWAHSAVSASLAAMGASALCDLYGNGLSSLAYFTPDIVASTVIFLPFAKKLTLPFLPFSERVTVLPKKLEQSVIIGEQKQKDTERRLHSLSEAMASLSETFFLLSDKRKRPGLFEIKQMCETCFEKNCRACRKNSECWSKEYLSTTDLISKLSDALYSLGRIEKDNIPEYMLSRCPNAELILEELNCLHADLLQKSVKANKTEVFAIDYEQMSKILAHAIIENDEEYEKDEYLTERVEKYMGYMNFHASCVNVCGKRKRSVHAYGVNVSKLTISSEELRRRFERICGVRFKLPSFNIENSYVTMDMEADRIFGVKSASATQAKEGERINGDGLYLFSNRQDYFYCLLSDGMGSGKSAALSSGITGLFLRKMLEAGNKKSISIEMLNHVLREKGGESSATVDLLEIDLLSGNASFIKSGAASSYIIRNGRLFNVCSNSMPVGITKEINAEEINLSLKDGDTVVMMSDGISQSFEDGIWIADLLSSEADKDEDLQVIANKILLNADLNSPRSDDMTVAVLKIQKL